MTKEITLTFSPDDGQGLRLKVVAPSTPAAGEELTRTFLDVDAAKLDDLRRGDPAPATVQEIAQTVSDWLLDPGLKHHLQVNLNLPDSLRLVVSMDRAVRGRLGELPLELVQLPNTVVPLVIHPRIEAIVHLLPFVGQPPGAATVRTWPLRILLVRSNPADLGGAVPHAAEVRDAIMSGADNDERRVSVSVLSSEEAGAPPVTWQAFRQAVADRSNDILVYLGHGDVGQTFADLEPIGLLQFESEDGLGHESVDARRIAAELFRQPIPVVLLAGCLTASEVDALDDEQRQLVRDALPVWLRGSQGVAQALVDSEAGVQLAVGMRYRLEVDHARRFLHGFFRSLIKTAPGSVELAIREGRNELFAAGVTPPSWSAPVVFGNQGGGPALDFLVSPPPEALPEEKRQRLEGLLEMRRKVWQALIGLGGRQAALETLLAGLIGDEEADLAPDASIRPRFLQTGAGAASMQIELVGSLKVRRLEARVTIAGERAEISRVLPAPRLDGAGFRLLTQVAGARAAVVLERTQGQAAADLAAGPLFELEVRLADTAQGGSPLAEAHEVSVVTEALEPGQLVWPGTDAIVVVPA